MQETIRSQKTGQKIKRKTSRKRPCKEELEKNYCSNKMSVHDIAEKYGVKEGTVHHWAWKMGIKRRPEIPHGKDELRELYLSKQMAVSEIADRYHVRQGTVRRWLSQAGIKKGDSCQEPYETPCKEELQELYISKRMTIAELADKYGVAASAIARWLREYGICKYRNTKTETVRGKKSGKPSKDIMKKLYLEERLNAQAIADKYDVSETTVRRWLRQDEIQKRKQEINYE